MFADHGKDVADGVGPHHADESYKGWVENDPTAMSRLATETDIVVRQVASFARLCKLSWLDAC